MLHLYPTEIILQAQLYKQTETRKRYLDNLVYLPTALSILKDWGLVGFCLHIAIGLAEYVKKRSPLMPHQQFLILYQQPQSQYILLQATYVFASLASLNFEGTSLNYILGRTKFPQLLVPYVLDGPKEKKAQLLTCVKKLNHK